MHAHKCASSAWKQFFFIDCLGLGELMGRSTRKSNSETSAKLNRREHIGMNHTDCQGKYQTKGEGSYCSSSTRSHDEQARAKTLDLARGTKALRRGAAKRPDFKKLKQQRSAQRPQARKKSETIRSPTNKALIQTDPLFHLYLICVGLITLSILAIKCLIPGMPIYTHTVIGFAFLLAIILVSTIYTQVKSKKVSASTCNHGTTLSACSLQQLSHPTYFVRAVWNLFIK